MALDTRNKRASALMLPILPDPDSAINQADRQQASRLYAGVLAGGAVATKVLRRLLLKVGL